MSVATAIYYLLEQNAGVTALVSTNVSPKRTGQTIAPPYITYSIISTVGNETKDQVSLLDKVRVQLDIYASTKIAADDIAAAVRTALDMASTTHDTHLQSIRFFNEMDGDFDDSALLDGLYRVIQEYNVMVYR